MLAGQGKSPGSRRARRWGLGVLGLASVLAFAINPAAGLGAASPSPRANPPATRAEYIAQADPLCQASAGPSSQALKAYNRKLKQLIDRLQAEKFKGVPKLVSQTARALTRFTTLHEALTIQLEAVTPPTADAGTISSWLGLRRSAEAFGKSAARAMKRFNFRQFDRQIGRAAKADADGGDAIAGFGFQFCS